MASTALILGAGNSGRAAARLALAKGYEPLVLDSGKTDFKPGDGIRLLTGQDALDWRGHADLVVFSPGVPMDSPLAAVAYETHAPCVSELAFGASFIRCPIAAITGTNGKTTTVEMLEHCLTQLGYNAIAAGNIGLPMSQVALDNPPLDFLVAEVSSFQLEFPGDFSPCAAALLNITPDHLVRHHSMENYARIKASIFKYVKVLQNCCVNINVLPIIGCAQTSKMSHYSFFASDDDPRAAFCVQDGCLVRREQQGGTTVLVPVKDLPFLGRHNLENALAALALAQALGVPAEKAAAKLLTFKVGRHRLENVCQTNGITFIDDSKATNVDALVKALQALAADGRGIALIAGGLDKDCSLEEALPALRANVKSLVLIGQCADRLMHSWGRFLPAQKADTMAEAVEKAAASLDGGGIVLLSPACASQDMFRNYEHRGDEFAKAARALRN